MKGILPGLATLLVPVVLVGCAGSPAQDKAYDVKGKVVAIDSKKKHHHARSRGPPRPDEGYADEVRREQPEAPGKDQTRRPVQGKLRVKPGGDYLITDLQKQ